MGGGIHLGGVVGRWGGGLVEAVIERDAPSGDHVGQALSGLGLGDIADVVCVLGVCPEQRVRGQGEESVKDGLLVHGVSPYSRMN